MIKQSNSSKFPLYACSDSPSLVEKKTWDWLEFHGELFDDTIVENQRESNFMIQSVMKVYQTTQTYAQFARSIIMRTVRFSEQHMHLKLKHCNLPPLRLRNDLYCVGWGVKLYSLTSSLPAAAIDQRSMQTVP